MKLKAWQIYLICIAILPFVMALFIMAMIPDQSDLEFWRDVFNGLVETIFTGGIILVVYYIIKRVRVRIKSKSVKPI